VLLVALHVRAYPMLSPIDELQHVDYTLKAAEFDIPRINELVGSDAMSEAACRSIDAEGYIGPICGLEEYDPADFPENGVNTAASQYPPYYVATGLVSRAVVAIGVVGSEVTAARMLGALWSGAAWSVMWYVMGLLRIPRLHRSIAVTLLMVTPLTLFHSATVNADTILMLTGALAVLATLKYESRRLHPALLLATYVALFIVEATNILTIAACAGYLAMRTTVRPGAPPIRRALPLLVFPLLLTLRLAVGRQLLRFIFPAVPKSASPTAAVDNASDGLDGEFIAAQLDANFLPITKAYLPPFLRTQYAFSFIQLTNWLLIGLMFVAAIETVRQRRAAWLARIGIVTLLLSGPFYTFSFAFFSDSDFPAPGRFALPMIVFIVVTAASAMRTRVAVGAAGTVAATSAGYTLFLLLSA